MPTSRKNTSPIPTSAFCSTDAWPAPIRLGAVDDLRETTREAHPDMPEACENMFLRSKIRAWANEVGVKVITVVGGKLAVEPISVPDSTMTPLRREGARYIAQTKKLQVPMKHFESEQPENLMEAIVGVPFQPQTD